MHHQAKLNPGPALTLRSHPNNGVGILAFGSLIGDPGSEIGPRIAMRVKSQTPFGVEYGRYSTTRGGAPTLVPHSHGAPVSGEIIVLDDTVIISEARDMLWRRERRREGTGEVYVDGNSPNAVLVCQITDSPSVNTLLYTDFCPTGKIDKPTANELALNAVRSVKVAPDGKDGISYLINNIAAGILTPLTAGYAAAILMQTETRSLHEALRKAKGL